MDAASGSFLFKSLMLLPVVDGNLWKPRVSRLPKKRSMIPRVSGVATEPKLIADF